MEDVVFGIVRSGMTAPIDRINEMMGPTLISIPVRPFPARGACLADYLSDVERSTSEAALWEQYRLDSIKNLSKSAAKAYNFQLMVITQHRPQNLGEENHNGLYLGDYNQHGAWSDECLTLEGQPLDQEKILVSLSYNNGSLAGNDIRRVSQYFCKLLAQVVSRPGCPTGDLDMVGPETIRQTLRWNNHPTHINTQRIEQLFHERLAGWPTLIAVVGVDAAMTNRELDQSYSAMADKLRDADICKGDSVPLCLEKTLSITIAILGLLKAGAAYVPMEIGLPVERMRHLLRE
ncbi:MAG: hypothetical protein Q9192_009109, partial [Flavoplaca navasiana]